MSDNAGYLRFVRDLPTLARRTSFAITGDADFLKRELLRQLRAYWQQSAQADEECFTGTDRGLKVSQIEQSLIEYPMIGKFRLVMVDALDKVKDWRRLDEWLTQLPPETKMVATFSDDFDLPKDNAFSCCAVCNSFNVESKEFDKYVDFCLEQMKKTIDDKAREYLRSAFVDQVYRLRMELLKVSFYLGSRQQITVDDLEKVLTVSSQTRIFDLVDAIVQRDLHTSLRLLKLVMDAGDDAISVINLVSKRVSMLSTIIRGLKTGESLKELMIRKKLPLFQFGRILENLKVLKDYHIVRFNTVLCEHEYKLRSWEDPRLTLESMVVTLCS